MRPPGRRPVAVVGRDPRTSGEFLEAAVVAGLASSGVDVLRLGVIPTPAVAYLTGALDAEFGVMLSASHNPAPDNGIKFFARGGVKLPDEVEDEIERRLAGAARRRRACRSWLRPGHGRVEGAGTLPRPPAGHAARLGGRAPLAGMRVVVDCAHGAAYEIAPRMLRRAGAEVIAIGAEPDGRQHQRGLRLDQPGRARGRGGRATAPTSASPTTGTPTGASRSTRTARSSTATRSSRCSRSR